MSLHYELPIYHDAYELMRMATFLTSNFRRDFKSTIGKSLRDECVEMGIIILRANSVQGQAKVPHIDALLEKVEMTNLMLRLSRDMKLITIDQYAEAIELVGQIGKQAGGWKKKSATPAASPPRR